MNVAKFLGEFCISYNCFSLYFFVIIFPALLIAKNLLQKVKQGVEKIK